MTASRSQLEHLPSADQLKTQTRVALPHSRDSRRRYRAYRKLLSTSIACVAMVAAIESTAHLMTITA